MIIPTYDGAAFILRAMRAVLNQTYRNLEMLVIDDGSRDGTVPLARSVCDPRLQVRECPHRGVAAARNAGAAEAQGEYLAFLDVDDQWHPRFLECAVETIRRHARPACLVYGAYYLVDDAGALVAFSRRHRDDGLIFAAVLQHEGLLLPSATVMHRSVFESVGGFSEQSHFEDRVFFLQATKRFPVFPIPQRLVIYRRSPEGRCRGVLGDFQRAIEAEESIAACLATTLTEEECALLQRLQMRNLFVRFLTNDFAGFARTLYPEVHRPLLARSAKGCLARWSMRTGINLVFRTRVCLEFVFRWLLRPWWKRVLLSFPASP